MSFDVTIKGIPEAKLMFDVAGASCNKASREYVQKMGRLAVKEEKNALSNDPGIWTRALYKSLGTKIPYFTRLNYYVSISGPKKNYRLFIRDRKSGKYAGKPLYAIPSRYAHLVEHGTAPRYTQSDAYRGIMPAFHYTEVAYHKLSNMNKLVASQIYKKALNG